jgi:hypothetical protein
LKLRLEHDLPRKVRYAKVYLQVGSATLYMAVDGSSASWVGSIGGKKGPAFVSDKEYSRYRIENPAEEVLDSDGERIILKNSEGYEEEWVAPRWVMTGIRKARRKGRE